MWGEGCGQGGGRRRAHTYLRCVYVCVRAYGRVRTPFAHADACKYIRRRGVRHCAIFCDAHTHTHTQTRTLAPTHTPFVGLGRTPDSVVAIEAKHAVLWKGFRV